MLATYLTFKIIAHCNFLYKKLPKQHDALRFSNAFIGTYDHDMIRGIVIDIYYLTI